jgi:uncharacterized protein DUF2190
MPYNRPGFAKYAKNETGGTLKHGQPACDETGTFVGVAIKQKAPGFGDGMAVQALIADDEEFMLLTKGVVMVDTISGLAVGDDVWLIKAENKLTETEGSNLKFGRVVEVAGERGVPAGKVRIDLDAKDSL